MRAIVQRVLSAKVEVEGDTAGQIGRGVLCYLSVGKGDSEKEAEFFARKIAGLRIFEDEQGKMNLSVQQIGGAVLMISNFTLHGDCRKGRRPSFDSAGEPGEAERLYEKVAELIRAEGLRVETGVFGAHMHVESINDGPVNFLLIE
ncbi:MAG: D-aminoacyl-tRNA deacylase [Planctomycetota bacterium]